MKNRHNIILNIIIIFVFIASINNSVFCQYKGGSDEGSFVSRLSNKVCPPPENTALGGASSTRTMSVLIQVDCTPPNLAFGGSGSLFDFGQIDYKICQEPTNLAKGGKSQDTATSKSVISKSCSEPNLAFGGNTNFPSQSNLILSTCTVAFNLSLGGYSFIPSYNDILYNNCVVTTLAYGGNNAGYNKNDFLPVNCHSPPNTALGGNSAGYTVSVEFNTMCSDFSFLASGGNADGVAIAQVNLLSCNLPVNLAFGGTDEGYNSKVKEYNTCISYILSLGGNGEGYSQNNKINVNCNNPNLSIGGFYEGYSYKEFLYCEDNITARGGIEDGFQKSTVYLACADENVIAKGGIGNGFSQNSVLECIPVILAYGGQGDGTYFSNLINNLCPEPYTASYGGVSYYPSFNSLINKICSEPNLAIGSESNNNLKNEKININCLLPYNVAIGGVNNGYNYNNYNQKQCYTYDYLAYGGFNAGFGSKDKINLICEEQYNIALGGVNNGYNINQKIYNICDDYNYLAKGGDEDGFKTGNIIQISCSSPVNVAIGGRSNRISWGALINISCTEPVLAYGGNQDGFNYNLKQNLQCSYENLALGGANDGYFFNNNTYKICTEPDNLALGGLQDGFSKNNSDKYCLNDQDIALGGNDGGYAKATYGPCLNDRNIALGGQGSGFAFNKYLENFSCSPLTAKGGFSDGFVSDDLINNVCVYYDWFSKGGNEDGFNFGTVSLNNCPVINLALGGNNSGYNYSYQQLIDCIIFTISQGGENSGYNKSQRTLTDCTEPNIALGGTTDGFYSNSLNVLTCPLLENLAQGGNSEGYYYTEKIYKNCAEAPLSTGGNSDGFNKGEVNYQTCIDINLALGGDKTGYSKESYVFSTCPEPVLSFGGNEDGYNVGLLQSFLCLPNLSRGGDGAGSYFNTVIYKSCPVINLALGGNNEGYLYNQVGYVNCPDAGNLALGGNYAGYSDSYVKLCFNDWDIAKGGNFGGFRMLERIYNICLGGNLAKGGDGDGFKTASLQICFNDRDIAKGGIQDGFVRNTIIQKTCVYDPMTIGGVNDGYGKVQLDLKVCTEPNLAKGGNYEGYSYNIINNFICSDPISLAIGGFNDGYKYSDIIPLSCNWNISYGGNGEGFNTNIKSDIVCTDPISLALGGNNDGFNFDQLNTKDCSYNIALGGDNSGFYYNNQIKIICNPPENIALGDNGSGFNKNILNLKNCDFNISLGGNSDGYYNNTVNYKTCAPPVSLAIGGNAAGFGKGEIAYKSCEFNVYKGGNGNGSHFNLFLQTVCLIENIALGGNNEGYTKGINIVNNCPEPVLAYGGIGDGFSNNYNNIANCLDLNLAKGGDNDGYILRVLNSANCVNLNLAKGSWDDGANKIGLILLDCTPLYNYSLGGVADGFSKAQIDYTVCSPGARGGYYAGYTDNNISVLICENPPNIAYGGNNDGFSKDNIIQIDCTPEYTRGGNYDGSSFNTFNNIVCPDPISLALGGSQDGYKISVITQISCDYNVALGGDNNGYNINILNNFTCPVPLSIALGGEADGFSNSLIIQKDCNINISMGGDNNGFYLSQFNSLICPAPLSLAYGGDNDGLALNNVTSKSCDINLALGGNNDGFYTNNASYFTCPDLINLAVGGNNNGFYLSVLTQNLCDFNLALGGNNEGYIFNTLSNISCPALENLSLGGNNAGFVFNTLINKTCGWNIALGGDYNGAALGLLTNKSCIEPNLALGGNYEGFVQNSVNYSNCLDLNIAKGGANDGADKKVNSYVGCSYPNLAYGGDYEGFKNGYVQYCFNDMDLARGGSYDGFSKSNINFTNCNYYNNIAYGGEQDGASYGAIKLCFNDMDIAKGGNYYGYIKTTIDYIACPGLDNLAVGGNDDGYNQNLVSYTTCILPNPSDWIAVGGSSDGFDWQSLIQTICTEPNLATGGNNNGFNSVINMYQVCPDPVNIALGGENDGFNSGSVTYKACDWNVAFGGDNNGFNINTLNNISCPDPLSVAIGGNDDGYSASLLTLKSCDFNLALGGNNNGFNTNNFIYINCPDQANLALGGNNEGYSINTLFIKTCAEPNLALGGDNNGFRFGSLINVYCPLHFKTTAAGNWSNNTIWLYSADSTAWYASLITPTTTATSTRIAHNVTVNQSVVNSQLYIDNGVTLTVANGNTLTINKGKWDTNLNVSGTIDNLGGIIVNSPAGVLFKGTARYIHNLNGDVIPSATWAIGSICEIAGISNTYPAGLNQSFYDFYWNNSSLSGGAAGSDITVNNEFKLMQKSFTIATAYKLTLGTNANLSGETTNQYIIGKLQTTRNVGTGSNVFGNIGLSVDAGSDDIGSVSIVRVAGPDGIVNYNSYTGIARKWKITPESQPVSGRTITFNWLSNDDNGKDLSDLKLWKSDDNENSWFSVGNPYNAPGRSIAYYTTSMSDWTIGNAELSLMPEINIKQAATDIPNNGTYNTGSILVGNSSSAIIFTIQNLGNADLNLTGSPKIVKSGLNATEFTIDESITTSPVSGFSSTTFTITFTPGAMGTRTAQISIANNDADETPYIINLTGIGLAPEINIKQAGTSIADGGTFNFGGFDVGANSGNITFTVENIGNSNLTITGSPKIVKSGTNQADFTINESSTLSPVSGSSSTTFTVNFSPSSVGIRTAQLSIANNDSDENPYIINISGTGLIPEINVKQGANSIVSGGSYDFGNINVGSNSGAISFTIENLDAGSLLLTGSPKIVKSGTNQSDFTINETMTISPVTGNSSTTFTISFAPSLFGTRTASVSIANNDSDENPYIINLTGIGLAPEIKLSQSGIELPSGIGFDFGNINVGSNSGAIVFTIENIGNSNLNLTGSPKIVKSGTNQSDYTIDESITVSPVLGSNSTTFTITFAPSVYGTSTASISIANNDSDENPYIINLTGTGLAPEINLKQGVTNISSGGTHNFGSVNVGSNSGAISFTIENLGNSILNLTGSPKIVKSGSNQADFTIDESSTVSPVNGAGSTTFTITFVPSAFGTRTASISIANNDSNENPYVINLTGIGLSPEINIARGASSIPNSGDYDFGNINVGSNSGAIVFTIENLGNSNLILSGSPKIVKSGVNQSDFTVDESTTGSPVSGGFTTTFKITFTPATYGTRFASISIANNDLDENPYVINLSGTGLAPEININQAGNNISSGGTYDFGSINVGSNNPVVFTIENIGNSNLNLTGSPKVVKSGTNPNDYTIDETMTINPVTGSTSTIVTVTFEPLAYGIRTASISIANNDSDENPYIINLTGVGLAPEINLKQGVTTINSGGSYNFGNVNVGSNSGAITFTIENLGNSNLGLPGTPKIVKSGTDPADFEIDETTTISPVSGASSTTFTITFIPSVFGSRSASISIANTDSDENPYVINLNGTGFAPEINLNQAGTNIITGGFYDFGSINVGSNIGPVSFTIENTGNSNLILSGSPKIVKSGSDLADFIINETSTVSPVTGGLSTTFTITFTPSSYGIRTANISIANNDSDENPYVINLTGTGLFPDINITQSGTTISNGSGFDFGNFNVGSNSGDITFTIENLGNLDLSLIDNPKIVKGGANSDDFIINEILTSSPVGSGVSTTFTISFTPSDYGIRTANIAISNNDTDENPYIIYLTGTGLAPEINLKQAITNIANGGSYDFGNVNVGSNSGAISFTIENIGNINLNLNSSPKVIKSGANQADFTIDETMTISPVSGNSSTTFTVTFSPSAFGSRTAAISIANNDSDENPYVIYISGTGLSPDINIKQGIDDYLTNSTYDFDVVNIGYNSGAVTFTIENFGNSNLILSGSPKITKGGAHPDDFIINESSTISTIIEGNTTSFTITFAPTQYGVRDAFISIANNDIDENPYIINLTGIGLGAEINLKQGANNISSGSNYDFGSINLGSSSGDISFTIQNLGNGNLQLTGNPKISKSGLNVSDFILNQATVTSPITGGNSKTFTIRFTPSGFGNLSAQISITNNDFDENPYIINLTGTGIAPEISVSQGGNNISNGSTYDFGNINVGSNSGAISFTIDNLGNSDLNLTGTPYIAISGLNQSEFNIDQSSIINPITGNNSTAFTITFAPVLYGPKQATISISNNDLDENPFSFNLTATGLGPEIKIKVKQKCSK